MNRGGFLYYLFIIFMFIILIFAVIGVLAILPSGKYGLNSEGDNSNKIVGLSDAIDFGQYSYFAPILFGLLLLFFLSVIAYWIVRAIRRKKHIAGLGRNLKWHQIDIDQRRAFGIGSISYDNTELVKYVARQIRKGVSKSKIIEYSKKTGWNQKEIEEAYTEARSVLESNKK